MPGTWSDPEKIAKCNDTLIPHFTFNPDYTFGISIAVITVLLAVYGIYKGFFAIFLNRKNIIVILMSIELILLAVNINLVSFSIYLGDLSGQVFTLFILTVAAAEAAIGLAIIVVYFRNSGTIRVEEIDKLKG